MAILKNRVSSFYLNKEIKQQDDVFVNSKLVTMESLTGMSSRKGLENAVISNGKLVNVVSANYGHLQNENFFLKVEEALINEDIHYKTRSINRDDRSFSVDYILDDDSYHIDVKGNNDDIKPMLSFINSYDGSCKTIGMFGFFRQVCSNGLHIAQTKIGFSVKHTKGIEQVVLPQISGIVAKFMDNEYYELNKKIEVLAEEPIKSVEHFVRFVCGETGLFKYEASEKNPEPGANARLVMDIMRKETRLLGEHKISKWVGYNAFNQVLCDKLKKSFGKQNAIDKTLFEVILNN